MPALRLSRRVLMRAAVALTGGLVASACAPKVVNESVEGQKEVTREVTQQEPAQKQKVVIRFGKFAGDVWAHDDLFAKKLMEEYPYIDVQIEDVIYGEAFKKGLALAATGTMWDVFSGFTRWMPYLAWKGVCLQLDDMIDSHDIGFDDFFPSVIADVRLWMDNRTYWLPSIVHPAGNAGLAMNKTLLDEANVQLPEGVMEGDWTISDLEEAMRAVSKPKEIFGIRVEVSLYRVQQLCRTWGEDPQKGSTDAWLLSADGKKVQLGDEWPRVKAALEWSYNLTKEGIVPTSADIEAVTGSNLFMAGKQLATGMSVDHVPRLVGQVGDRFEMIFVPWPKGPNGHRGSALSYINQSVSSQTKNPEEAFLLVAQLTGKEHALYRATEMEGGCTMARHSASFSEKLWSQPGSGPLMRFAAQWLEAGVDPFPQLYNLRAIEFDSVWSQEVGKYWNGEEDWIEMVSHATEACQAVIDLERP